MTADANLILLVFALTGALLFAGVGAYAMLGQSAQRERSRRRRLGGLARHRTQAIESNGPRLAKTVKSDGLLARLLPRREVLRLRLERTGRSISVAQYVGVSLGIVVVLTVAMHVGLHLGKMASLLVGLMVGIGLPYWWLARAAKQRVAQFMAQLPEAIDLMVRALRSGLPISEAIINAGHEVPGPVGEEFRGVENALRLGRSLDDVLWDTARRLEVPEFRFFVISMSVQRETGGNLAETLATLAEMLRRRRQMKLKIKALSSEARASAMVLGALPFLVTAAMFFTSPDYIGRMFADPRGLLLCGIGILLMLVGGFVMAKIINFDI